MSSTDRLLLHEILSVRARMLCYIVLGHERSAMCVSCECAWVYRRDPETGLESIDLSLSTLLLSAHTNSVCVYAKTEDSERVVLIATGTYTIAHSTVSFVSRCRCSAAVLAVFGFTREFGRRRRSHIFIHIIINKCELMYTYNCGGGGDGDWQAAPQHYRHPNIKESKKSETTNELKMNQKRNKTDEWTSATEALHVWVNATAAAANNNSGSSSKKRGKKRNIEKKKPEVYGRVWCKVGD